MRPFVPNYFSATAARPEWSRPGGRRTTKGHHGQERRRRRGGPPPRTTWDLDPEGRFLLLPVAERDLAWALECCDEHAEGRWHMLRDGAAVLFERADDLAFVRFACL